MNKHRTIYERLSKIGFCSRHWLNKNTKDEPGHLAVMAFNMMRILRNLDLLDKYPASYIFDNRDIIPSGTEVFDFTIEKDWAITPQKLIQVVPADVTRWIELPNSIDIIKLELWVSQSDAIMTDITEKIQQIIQEETN